MSGCEVSWRLLKEPFSTFHRFKSYKKKCQVTGIFSDNMVFGYGLWDGARKHILLSEVEFSSWDCTHILLYFVILCFHLIEKYSTVCLKKFILHTNIFLSDSKHKEINTEQLFWLEFGCSLFLPSRLIH